jgi:integrase
MLPHLLPRMLPCILQSPIFKKNINGYGDKVSKWFNRTFLKNHNLKTSKKTFHSLRHTFINALKQNEVDQNITDSITGHCIQSMSYGRYGGTYKITTLRNTVNSVDYNL